MKLSYSRLRPLFLSLPLLATACAASSPPIQVAQTCPKLPPPPYALPTAELMSWLGASQTWQMREQALQTSLEAAPSGSKP